MGPPPHLEQPRRRGIGERPQRKAALDICADSWNPQITDALAPFLLGGLTAPLPELSEVTRALERDGHARP
mgnify:CR=1 FL=1